MKRNHLESEKFVHWFRTLTPGLRFVRSRLHRCEPGLGAGIHRWPSVYSILDAEVVGVTLDPVGRPVRYFYLLVYPGTSLDDGCGEAGINPAAIDDGVGTWQGIKQPLGAMSPVHSSQETLFQEMAVREVVRKYWTDWHAKQNANRLRLEQQAAAALLATPPKPKRWWQLWSQK
jgi:hypothetical protein